MFDLFRSRAKAVRIFLGAILVLVSLSMLTYLIPSYGTGEDAADTVVARVGKEVITVPEVNKVLQVTIRGRQIPPSVLPSYIPTVVDGMVMNRALEYEAKRMGFQVSDAELRDALRQMIPDLFPNGVFVGKQAYASYLAAQNVSIEEFEADVRRQMYVAMMDRIAQEGTVVTPAEIEQEYRRKYEKIKVEYVKVNADRYKAEAQPTPQEDLDYFKANTARYQVPEKKNLAILIADQAKLEQTLNPTDADLERMYNQNKDSFRTPERVRVRHILLKTMDKPASEDAKIKAQAEDLLKKIRGGANFGELAKKYSEDTTSAQNAKSPGELPDWISRGQTVPEFEKVAFSQKPGQTSDLVKTSFGYHIIQVLAHEDARLQPLSEVKDKLVAEWRKQRVNDILQNISDKVQAELQKDPTHPEKVAAEFNMQLVRADGVAPNQAIPEIGVSPDFESSLMGLKQNGVSAPVALPGNKIALAVVTGIVPARPATFEEVQTQVRDYIVQTRSANALQKHVQELLTAARKAGNLASAAKAMGLEAKTSEPFSRDGTAEGIGPATYLQEAFNRANGTVVGPYSAPDGTIVAQVVEHIAPDMSKLAQERSTIAFDVKSRKAQDRLALFHEGVRSALKKQGKIKVNDAVIRRLITNYGSSS